jgi:pyruvate,water dikinase
VLGDATRVRELSVSALALAVDGITVGLPDEPFVPGPPLPTMFRLDARRTPVDQRPSGTVGTAASVGRATGIVRHASTPPTPGRRDVLVVDALVPELAAELDHVAAIVSETGSPLSHLAILARELSIPVAVGVEDARTRFPEGCRVLVDGGSGSVTTEPEAIAS